ncbi:MAG TPA: gliding motility-associated C-terminal domain-containing protein [Flavisolibacter sp.]|nr:gliding motility-associated C-terminal domain-containing protein [Flavisolibacter sp.]
MTSKKPNTSYVFFILLLFLFTTHNLIAQPSCTDSSFRKIFFVAGDTLSCIDRIATADQGSLLVGKYLPSLVPQGQGFLLKLDSRSDLLWSKKYELDDPTKQFFATRTTELPTGEYIVGGRIARLDSPYYQAKKLVLFKSDANGNILWSNSFEYNPSLDPQAHLTLQSVTIGQGSDILVTCTINSPLGEYCLIIKLNSAGTILWSKSLMVPDMGLNQFFHTFAEGSDLVVWGLTDDGLCPNDTRSLVAIKLDYTSGIITQTKRFCFNAPLPNGLTTFTFWTYNFSAKKINGEYVLYGVLGESNPSERDFVVFRFDAALNFLSGRAVLNPGPLRQLPYIDIDEVGNIHFINQRSGSGGRQFFFSTITRDGTVSRQRKLVYSGGRYDHFNLEGGRRVLASNKQANFAINYYDAGKQESVIELLQLHDNDATSEECMGEDTAIFSRVESFELLLSGTWSNSITNVHNPVIQSAVILKVSNAGISQQNVCSKISRCDSLRIAGPDTICVSNNFLSFTTLRNPECQKRVEWQIASSMVDSSFLSNDSTFNIRFKPIGDATASLPLYASVSNCLAAKDTLLLTLLPGPQALPADTIVCDPALSLRLTPGKWLRDYQWQDGSTDSVFTATMPGTYWVNGKTKCGSPFTDTVRITFAQLNLRGPQMICSGDTATLRSAPGYTNYLWTPHADFFLLNDSVAKVFPKVTQRYTVSAQVATSGCTVSDTIELMVLQPTPVALGKDTSICEGETFNLDAGAGFLAYAWNDSTSGQYKAVTRPGQYIVTVMDANGCQAKDTFNLVSLFPRPTVNIHQGQVMCIGQTDVLNPGNSYAAYQWQDGSVGQTYKVSDTGIYWVRVLDENNCTNTDTAHITKLVSPPANFIYTDTLKCSFETIQLKPFHSFNQYLWSNGSIASTLEVSTSGLYKLKVTDGNGCFGEQTIKVENKDCPNRIFFPSAFSPNGDGRNDKFKPSLSGDVVKYEFIVYNRWGQIIFKTTDTNKGWDGDLRGREQGNFAFVWMCRYQFRNEKEQIQKGTAVLIK